MKRILSTLCLLTFVTISCDKDEDSKDYTTVELLTASKWNLIDYYNEYYDNDTLNYTNLYDQIGPCIEDNELQFNLDSSLSYIANNPCSSGDVDLMGTWSLNDEETKIILDYTYPWEYNIVSISMDELIISDTLAFQSDNMFILQVSKYTR